VFEREDKKTRSISCEICKYRTTTAAQLRKHMLFFHSDTEVKHQVIELPRFIIINKIFLDCNMQYSRDLDLR
jgi:hypothetical protein